MKGLGVVGGGEAAGRFAKPPGFPARGGRVVARRRHGVRIELFRR